MILKTCAHNAGVNVDIKLKGSVTVRYIFVYCRLLSLFAKNL